MMFLFYDEVNVKYFNNNHPPCPEIDKKQKRTPTIPKYRSKTSRNLQYLGDRQSKKTMKPITIQNNTNNYKEQNKHMPTIHHKLNNMLSVVFRNSSRNI